LLARQAKIIFEIGIFKGRTTINLALNAPKEAKVNALDLSNKEFNGTASERTYVITYFQKSVAM